MVIIFNPYNNLYCPEISRVINVGVRGTTITKAKRETTKKHF